MRITFLMIISILISCKNSNQVNHQSTDKIDSVVVVDKYFYDFIYDFMINKDFQLSRTKIEDWTFDNYFATDDYSLHLFKTFELPEHEFEKDISKEKFLTIIDTKSSNRTVLGFKKIDNLWYLAKKSVLPFSSDSVVDFESFLYKLSTDTVFLLEHVKYPFKFTYADPEKDFADTTEYLNKENMFKLDFFSNGKLLFFNDNNYIDSKRIMIFLRGIDNGLSVYYYFDKIDNEWFLIEENDYST